MQEQESNEKSIEEQASIMKERVEKLTNIDIRNEMSIRLRQTIDDLPHPLNERIAGFVMSSWRRLHTLKDWLAKIFGNTYKNTSSGLLTPIIQ